MTRSVLIAAVVAFALTAGALVADATPNRSVPSDWIHTITRVSCMPEEGNPSVLVITATAKVPTSGWTGARLDRVKTVKPPADGIVDYLFWAVRPKGNVDEQPSTVTATDKWKNPPKWLKGVRIHDGDWGLETTIGNSADADEREPEQILSHDEAKAMIRDFVSTSKKANRDNWVRDSLAAAEKRDMVTVKELGWYAWGPWTIHPAKRVAWLTKRSDFNIWQLKTRVSKQDDRFVITDVRYSCDRLIPDAKARAALEKEHRQRTSR